MVIVFGRDAVRSNFVATLMVDFRGSLFGDAWQVHGSSYCRERSRTHHGFTHHLLLITLPKLLSPNGHSLEILSCLGHSTNENALFV
jgi:hypothetical protein